jgi:hypothetical protein
MNTAVSILLEAAVASMCVGALTSLVPMLSLTRKGNALPLRPIKINTGPLYWNYAVWTVALGAVLILAPQSWYGPSWSYFASVIPHNGFGMGVCCTGLGTLLILSLWRDLSARIISILLFLTGFVYWTAGITLGAEGLLGHQGLMEAPFMLYMGAQAFSHSAALTAHDRLEAPE